MKKFRRAMTNGFLMYLILLWSLISLITFPTIGNSASSTEDWPMFRCNPEHTGFSISSAPTDNETTALLWSNTTGGAIRFSSPAVFGDWLFIGSEDGYVYAFNSTSGCQKWKSKFLGGQIQSSPAVSNDRVFVGSLDGKIYALNMTDGEASLWNKTIGNQVWSSPTVAYGKVYISSYNCTVYALNETTGNVIWRNYTAQPSKSSPAVADGKLFIGSLDCRVYAFNAENGTLEWNSTHLGGYIKESSPAILDETVFIGAANNTLYALHKSNGTVHWKGTAQGSIRSSPAVGYGKVYVGSEDDRVYAFNASTGAQVWNFTTGGDVCSSPAVAEGAVFVGSCDGKIYALNASTGEELWSHQTSGEIWSSPAVANGRVFVGSKDKKVYAFGKNTPPTASFEFDPIEPEVNENVTFNASNSSDPDPLDYITNYTWNFGDGSDITNTTAPIITHEYCEGGDYNVTLIVTDCYGAESSPDTQSLKVKRHEVTIVDVSPENVNVTKGEVLNINVTVKNQGDYNENVTVTVWCSNDTYKIPVNDAQNVSLLIDENRTLVFSWNTTHFTRGTYHISATVDDKEKDDGDVTILVHDLALSNIVANTTEVVINQTVSINITVYNEGDFTESNVTVTVYANSTCVGNCTGDVLKASSWLPKIEWNTTGFTLGNYSIWGSVTIVPNDVNFTNNNFTNGIVRVRPPFHDVSIVEILLSIPGPPYNITSGDSMNITVSVRNQGEYLSENVTVTTWYSNATTPRPVNITCVTLENLEKNETRPVPLPWDTTGFSGGYYTIGAYLNITGKDEYPDDNNETLYDKVLIIAPWRDIRVREVK
ncbi:PQQ-binding-like beta-propeller repeat protein, partial [Candidatus Bathyarchaeota archaeon]|nr:PQQ-binding-like beta-propeller repeat protein [Candidatus Bathyarchaeota archaeon]